MNENQHIIICVGRQLGSGGHDIARMLALDFGAKYYDQELLNLEKRAVSRRSFANRTMSVAASSVLCSI